MICFVLFREAKLLCDEDSQCGGFTYKGSRKLSDKEYSIFFFHILMNIEQDIHSLKWTVYKADKEFLTFQGVFQRKASPMSWSNMNKKKQSKPEARCRKLGSGCVGIEKNKNGSQIIFLEYLGAFYDLSYILYLFPFSLYYFLNRNFICNKIIKGNLKTWTLLKPPETK